MEANKAPKSKFVYPDKLYARCKDNKTLDISYAPQNMEAVEYTRTDVFIEKACEWLENNASNYIIEHPFSSDVDFEEDKMVEDFKNYMKGE